MMNNTDRMLVRASPSEAVIVEPMDVYWLEADGRTTWVRMRGRDRLRDHRSLGDVTEVFAAFGFLRIHRNHAVNLHRVAVLRRRRPGGDWEIKLEPPVNRVLPVARGKIQTLLAVFGGPR